MAHFTRVLVGATAIVVTSAYSTSPMHASGSYALDSLHGKYAVSFVARDTTDSMLVKNLDIVGSANFDPTTATAANPCGTVTLTFYDGNAQKQTGSYCLNDASAGSYVMAFILDNPHLGGIFSIVLGGKGTQFVLNGTAEPAIAPGTFYWVTGTGTAQ